MGKKNKGINYYAVAVGRRPDVYTTWKECEEQTNGWHNCRHKVRVEKALVVL